MRYRVPCAAGGRCRHPCCGQLRRPFGETYPCFPVCGRWEFPPTVWGDSFGIPLYVGSLSVTKRPIGEVCVGLSPCVVAERM